MSASAASIAVETLKRMGTHVLARVSESPDATDLALILSPASLAVLRCVARATPGDCTALETMVAERYFVWAGLFSSDPLGADWPGSIEAFQVTELPRLIVRLQELRRAAAP